jgi:hypothetical protein
LFSLYRCEVHPWLNPGSCFSRAAQLMLSTGCLACLVPMRSASVAHQTHSTKAYFTSLNTMACQSTCTGLMTSVPSRRPKAALHMGVPHHTDPITRTQQQPDISLSIRSLYQRQLPLHPGWWLLPLSPGQWSSPRPMHGAQAVAVSTPALPPPTSAFVVAAEPATTQLESDLFFGDLEGLEVSCTPSESFEKNRRYIRGGACGSRCMERGSHVSGFLCPRRRHSEQKPLMMNL